MVYTRCGTGTKLFSIDIGYDVEYCSFKIKDGSRDVVLMLIY
jgi:hypothetical protein